MPPVVPRRVRETVTAPLGSSRLDATVPDLGVSGAATAATNLVAEVAAKEAKSANNAAVTAAIADLSAFDTDLKYNIDTGILNNKNEAAFNSNGEAAEAYDKYRAEALAGLANDTQRELFTPHIDSKWANTDLATKKHAVNQKDSFQVEQVNNLLARETASAGQEYDNPESIGLSIGTFVQAFVEMGADQNIDPDSEEYQRVLEDGISGIHKSVISAMLADKKFADAREYHKENKDGIFDDDAIVASLKAGELVEASTIKATEIVTKSENLKGALEELNKIQKDPDNLPGFRDATRKRIKNFYSDRAKAEKAVSFESAEDAHRIMERPENEGRTVESVIEASYPGLWGTMNRTDKKGLESRFNKPIPETNDRNIYLELVDSATENPVKFAELTPSEIFTKTEKLDKTHRARVDALWKAAREKVAAEEAKGDKPPKTTNVLSAKDSATQVWKGAGLPPTTGRESTEESREAFAKFLSNVDLVVGEASRKEGRVLTAVEEREAIDKVMRETVIPEMSEPGFIKRTFGVEPEPTGIVDVQGIEVSTFAGDMEAGEKLFIQNPLGAGNLIATMGADGVLRATHPETGGSVPVDELRPKYIEEQTATLADGTPIVFRNGNWHTVEAE